MSKWAKKINVCLRCFRRCCYCFTIIRQEINWIFSLLQRQRINLKRFSIVIPIQSHRFCKCLYLWTQHNLSWEHFWGVRTKNNKTQAFQIPKTKQISIPTLHVKLTPGTYTHHSWCLHVYLSVCVWLSMAFNVNDIESKLTV